MVRGVQRSRANAGIAVTVVTNGQCQVARCARSEKGHGVTSSSEQVAAPQVRAGQLATAEGVSYLEAKNLLLLSYCTHIVFYLLLKAEGRPVRTHPVIGRLLQIRAYLVRDPSTTPIALLHRLHLQRCWFALFLFRCPLTVLHVASTALCNMWQNPRMVAGCRTQQSPMTRSDAVCSA